MKPEKILYTAHATSTGGREGTSKSDDGILDVKLTTPKGLGGNGAPGTNPEQLFAAGYSSCFIGAMKYVAMTQKIALPADTSIKADVGIGPRAIVGGGDSLANGFGDRHEVRDATSRQAIPVSQLVKKKSGHSPADPVHSRDVDRRWIAWLEKYFGADGGSQATAGGR